jgi:hypothetical protein
MVLNMYIVLAKEMTTYFVKSEEWGIAPLSRIVFFFKVSIPLSAHFMFLYVP